MGRIYNTSGGFRRLHSFNFTTIILIQRTTGLLGRQLNRLESDFVAKGGIKEKMYQARLESRNEADTPACPQCDKPMRKRHSTRGEFWGCSGYPDCKGTRAVDKASAATGS